MRLTMIENTEDTGLKFYCTSEIAEMLKMNVQVIARKLQYGELVGYKRVSLFRLIRERAVLISRAIM